MKIEEFCIENDEFADPKKPGAPSQKWQVTSNSDGTITIKQGALCVDNNYEVDVDPPALAHGGPWQPGAYE